MPAEPPVPRRRRRRCRRSRRCCRRCRRSEPPVPEGVLPPRPPVPAVADWPAAPPGPGLPLSLLVEQPRVIRSREGQSAHRFHLRGRGNDRGRGVQVQTCPTAAANWSETGHVPLSHARRRASRTAVVAWAGVELVRSSISHHDVRRVARPGGGRGDRRLPAAPAHHGGGDPGRAGPAAARAEPDHDPAEGGRPGRDPLGRARRADPGHADRAAGPQQRPAVGRLRRDADQIPALPRRLHLPGQVRHPRLGGRRPGQRPRDRGAGGGRARSRASCWPRWPGWRSSPGSSGWPSWRPPSTRGGHPRRTWRRTSSAARTPRWPSR